MSKAVILILAVCYAIMTPIEIFWLHLDPTMVIKMNGFMLASIVLGGTLGHKVAGYLAKKYKGLFVKGWVYVSIVILVYALIYFGLYLIINPFSYML